MPKLVSIIIPTFNRANLIVDTLNSVRSQIYANWECIVVDDGSNDDTESVVSQYSKNDTRFTFHKRPENRTKGANACRNYGFEISNGSIINWVDSDDILTTNHLQIHVDAHSQSDVDAVITNAKVFVDDISNVTRDWSAIVPKQDIITEMIATDILWQTNCVTWKKDRLPKTPFEEDLSSSQEWTFHLSQIINGITYQIVTETTCFMREHSQRIGKSVSVKKSFSTFESRRKIWRILAQKGQLDTKRELHLLKFMAVAFRQSISGKYKLSRTILSFLGHAIVKSKNKAEIARIIFIAFPIFSLTGKGEKLFRITIK